MKKIFLFLASVMLGAGMVEISAEGINEAYKGKLPIDSIVVENIQNKVVEKAIYEYNQEKQKIGFKTYVYDEYADSLVEASNQGYEMRDDTVVVKNYTYNDYTGEYVLSNFVEYCQDARGNFTYFASFYFSESIGEHGMWVSESIDQFTYDEQNRILTHSEYGFDFATLSGNVLQTKTFYTYESANLHRETIWFYDRDDQALYPDRCIEHRISGDSILTIQYSVDSYEPNSEPTWIQERIEAEIHHTADSVTTYEAYAHVDLVDDKWVFLGWEYRMRDRVVTKDRKTTTYTDGFVDGAWQIMYKKIEYFDAAGRLTRMYQYRWDDEQNKLVPNYASDHKYKTDGSCKTTFYRWDSQLNDWVADSYAPARKLMTESYSWDGSSRYETITDEDGTILRELEYAYNETTEVWDILIASRTYTYFYNGVAVLSGVPTGIQAATKQADKARKRVVDGAIVIEQNGKLFNLSGSQIR